MLPINTFRQCFPINNHTFIMIDTQFSYVQTWCLHNKIRFLSNRKIDWFCHIYWQNASLFMKAIQIKVISTVSEGVPFFFLYWYVPVPMCFGIPFRIYRYFWIFLNIYMKNIKVRLNIIYVGAPFCPGYFVRLNIVIC